MILLPALKSESKLIVPSVRAHMRALLLRIFRSLRWIFLEHLGDRFVHQLHIFLRVLLVTASCPAYGISSSEGKRDVKM